MAFAVTMGDRIAQLVLEKIVTPPVLEVDVSVSLSRLFLSTDAIPGLGGNLPRHQWVWLNWWSCWSLNSTSILVYIYPDI